MLSCYLLKLAGYPYARKPRIIFSIVLIQGVRENVGKLLDADRKRANKMNENDKFCTEICVPEGRRRKSVFE